MNKNFFGYDISQIIVISILFVLFLFICGFSYSHKENIPQNRGQKQENNERDHGQIDPINKSVFLTKGQSAPIVDNENNAIKSIYVGVGWSPIQATLYKNDVDSTVILVDSVSGETCEVCYYRLKGPSGCVYHHGDNLTGEDIQTNVTETNYKDDENIDVYLDKVPLGYDKIYFVLNIFEAYTRGQSLNMIQDMYINLYDSNNNLLMNYKVLGNTPGNAIILGVATRDVTYSNQLQNKDEVLKSTWTFKALGDTYFAKDIDELCITCSRL